MVAPLAERLRQRIRAEGSIAVSEFVAAALYDPREGFYTGASAGGRAGGHRGDFLTAPEVGPLFGAVIARAVDTWWVAAGRPSPFVVHEWGAGPGTLVRGVVRAEPEVLRRGALRWWAVEISAHQRAEHPDHPAVVSTAVAEGPAHVVLANELLDNLPFDLVGRADGEWREQRVGLGAGGAFALIPEPIGDTVAAVLDRLVPDPPADAVVPWQTAAREWLDHALGSAPGGRVVVLDYGADTATLGRRGNAVRTHRHHDDTRGWLDEPGSCDITADVAFDQLQLDRPAGGVRTQADFLRRHGIDDLVEEGRRVWEANAHVGDLAALAARSRVREAEALLDPAGMGGFVVLEWEP